MRFYKLHGLGNDFVFIDDREGVAEPSRYSELGRRLCDRRTGIGADGLVLMQRSRDCDIRMRIINSDGSEAEMCGNATRCMGKLAYELGLIQGERFTLETVSGVKTVELDVRGGRVCGARVDMGVPKLDKRDIPMQGEGECRLERIEVLGREFEFSAVNTGVPHAVLFVPDAFDRALMPYGAALERHTMFPEGVNVDFTTVVSRGRIKLHTWERSCGETLACGTGAAAAALCCFLAGRTERTVTAELTLGELTIELPPNGHIYMTGPAELSFTGEVDI